MLAEEIKLRGEKKLSHPKSVLTSTQRVHPTQPFKSSGEVLQEKALSNVLKIEDSQQLVSSAEESPKFLVRKELHGLLQCISNAEGSPEISGHRWMYFIDSGGQPQFQEVLQAFIPNTAVLLLVFKLTEPLSDIPLSVYQSAEGSSYNLGSHALSNQHILLRLARMLVLGHSQPDTQKSMRIIFIGTFKDEYEKMLEERKEATDKGKEAIETVRDKEAKLERLFEDFKDNIVHDTEGKMIFQVNGLHAEDGKFDDPVVSELSGVLHTQLV